MRAQQAAMPVIGFMSARSPDDTGLVLQAFLKGLGEAGFFDGQNVTIEYRWARGEYDPLPAFAAEFVRRHVNVLVATGGNSSALAAKQATSTIPIVFVAGDPVKFGLVQSLNRPGGNMTGSVVPTTEMDQKRLGLLHELVPAPAHWRPSESEFPQLRNINCRAWRRPSAHNRAASSDSKS